ncbi:FadR/GntR family transcriptional regulator [Sphingobium sp. HBC34]|uniref:FadR/GntR family transcriptional regulator n=1 Tax=Sphingobium cyanobacteriorum TaxID=3063954 RepID=A0ABT8ZID1_9SPHN|nr:FadR/GntR family transcriptional regulator [Sphingobium sp. HBC34]MDO7834302.1 FadR/GntR family transcriptional regulator [Sphingobium sp. HBC34]
MGNGRKVGSDEGVLRIHQTIARDLGTAILTGQYKPGDLFEGEIEASERLGVSRTAYREAVRILIARGMIESRPKAGTRVLPRSRWNVLDPEMLAWMFAGEPDPDFIRDLFELRGVIEPAAAEFAARRRTDDQLTAMEQALDDMGRYGLSTPEGRDADQRFHRAILAATRNDALSALASSVGAAVGWTTKFKHRKKLLPRDPLPDHRAVYQAIAARDTAAARASMAELLRLALADMDIAINEPGG